MKEPTKEAVRPAPDHIEAFCACCELEVRIHPGPPFLVYDLEDQRPYPYQDLPRSSPHGGHVVLCMACSIVAQKIIRAGEPFDQDVFQAAYDRCVQELRDHTPPDGSFGRGDVWGPSCTAVQDAATERAHAAALRNYRAVLEEWTQEDEDWERHMTPLLRLLPPLKDEEDESPPGRGGGQPVRSTTPRNGRDDDFS